MPLIGTSSVAENLTGRQVSPTDPSAMPLRLIRPVEVVVDPVAVLEAEVDAFRRDVEGALSAVAALPDEARVEVDRDEMLFSSDRVLQRFAPRLTDTGDRE